VRNQLKTSLTVVKIGSLEYKNVSALKRLKREARLIELCSSVKFGEGICARAQLNKYFFSWGTRAQFFVKIFYGTNILFNREIMSLLQHCLSFLMYQISVQ
jgi:hypothetical protein